MKFLTKANELYQKLRIVQNSTPTRSTVPILRSVKLEADEDGLTLTGTDLEIGVELQAMGTDVQTEGGIAVPADRFASLLREFNDQELEISTDQDILTIHSSDGTFKIVGHSLEDFPEFPEIEEGPEIEVGGNHLREMVTRTAFAVADEMQMYALTGIYSRWKPEKVEMVGSDGNRLARVKKRLKTGIEEEITVNIPPRIMRVLTSMIDENQDVTFTGDESKVLFQTENGRVYARQVEGNYPDYEKAIPKNPNRDATIDKEELSSALKKVSILTERDMPAVNFHFSEDGLRLSAQSQEFGEGKVKVPMEYNGDELEISFNPDYLLDVIDILEEEQITIKLCGPGEGGIIREGNNFLYVTMPLSQGNEE